MTPPKRTTIRTRTPKPVPQAEPAPRGFKTHQAEGVTPRGGDMAVFEELLGTDNRNVVAIQVPTKRNPKLKTRRTLSKD